MAVRISDTVIRYPDASIYCDQPPRDELGNTKALSDLTVVIKVLSPSTTTLAQGTKLDKYQSLPSIRTIAFVDPIDEMCRVIERQSEIAWRDRMFFGKGGIAVPTLDLVISHDEIVARD